MLNCDGESKRIVCQMGFLWGWVGGGVMDAQTWRYLGYCRLTTQ